MARAKTPKRESSRHVDRDNSDTLMPGLQKGRSRTAGESIIAAQAPIFTTSLQLSELGKAVSHIDLSPLSSLGSRFAQNFPTLPSPLGKPAGIFAPHPPQTTIISVETLGALVRAHREEFALSQQSFAERAGVGRRFISELENGKPSLEFDKVLAVARAAGIDLFAVRRTPSTP